MSTLKPSILTARAPDETALRAVLDDSRLKWAYGERMEDVILCHLGDLLAGRVSAELGHWLQGRAFGPALEVRWIANGEGYRLLALSEGAPPPQAEKVTWRVAEEAREMKACLRWVLLRGAYKDRERIWIEARIPRPLVYPITGNPAQVRIVCVDYRRNGATVVTRMRKVVPYGA